MDWCRQKCRYVLWYLTCEIPVLELPILVLGTYCGNAPFAPCLRYVLWYLTCEIPVLELPGSGTSSGTLPARYQYLNCQYQFLEPTGVNA
jgi:hypothetical protein